jgi:hypothetical protein
MIPDEDQGSKTNGLPLKNWGCLAVGLEKGRAEEGQSRLGSQRRNTRGKGAVTVS